MSFVLLGILNSQAAGAAGFESIAGYILGGNEGGSNKQRIDKFAFPSDTRSTQLFGLSTSQGIGAGFQNPNTAGYIAGGNDVDNNRILPLQKVAFPTDTVSNSTSLSHQRAANMAFSNANVAGYTGGGFSHSDVDKFTFPADTRTVLSIGLPTNTTNGTGFEDRFVAGYSAGNEIGDSPTVTKFIFPADTRTTLGTGLSLGRHSMAGFSNPAVAGYVAGGANFDGGVEFYVSTVDKFSFPTDSRSTLGTGIASNVSRLSGFANPGVAGYAAGGGDAGTLNSQNNKFDFATDSRSLTTGLSAGRRDTQGFQNA